MESLSLAPWTAQRRQDLLGLFDQLNGRIAELSLALQREAAQYSAARRLMTHPGVGPITALAFTLVMGPWERFRCGKQVGSYLGLIPSEDSSGDHQRLGHISKQGNALLRWLLVEAAHAAVRSEPQWRRKFMRLAMRRGPQVARVALAHKLAVRLYWMLRRGWDYEQMLKFSSHAG